MHRDIRDIAVCIMTFDRRAYGKKNYLEETLDNFTQVGGFLSDRFHSLHIVDGGSPAEGEWPHQGIKDIAYTMATPGAGAGYPHVFVHASESKVLSCQNAARTLRAGIGSGAPWVLFCEDDLDFCGDFLESVGHWLDLFGDDKYPAFVFGAAYPATSLLASRGIYSWEYPIRSFYGTQCFAMRPAVAAELAAYWDSNPQVNDVWSPSAYDLMMQQWVLTYRPRQKFFLASCPSFVQHIGRQSIATGKPITHTFDSYPGRNWAFTEGVMTV